MSLNNLLVCRDLLKDKIIKDINKVASGEQLDKNKISAKLIKKAEKLGLSQNIIKTYIIYVLVHKVKLPISIIEHTKGQVGKSLYEAFCQDINYIEDLLILKPSILLDCPLLDDYQPTTKNSSLAFNWLLTNLQEAIDVKSKADIFLEYYRVYGSGDMADYKAFCWNNDKLVGIKYFETMQLKDLIGYDYQKQQLLDNTQAFVENRPANNVLLVGARGTGKSSGVKAIVNSLFTKGLRLVQITKEQLIQLPFIMEKLRTYSNKKFIIFLDDLSFEEFEVEYKCLKSAIEGGVSARPENVLIYATSNRRHLIKESYKDRRENDDDIHRNDTLNETISLSDRFGLILYYMMPNQQEYLNIVDKLLQKHGIILTKEELRIKAGAWEKEHSGRSGRTAQQFVTHYLGQVQYKNKKQK